MKIKIVGIFVCMLLITTVLPASGIINVNNNLLKEQQIPVEKSSISNNGDDIDWWPMFQHDPEHTGYSTSKAPNTDNILWSFEGNHGCFSTPVVVNNKVFIGSQGSILNGFSGRFYCLDAETGNPLWIKTYPKENIFWGSPSVDDDKLYVSPHFIDNSKWEFCCYNVFDGSLIWKNKDYGTYFTGTTIVDSRLLLCGIKAFPPVFIIYCLNPATGGMIWNCSMWNIFSCCPAVVDDKLFINRQAEWASVVCLNASTGETVWAWINPIEGGVDGSPSIYNNKLYFGTTGYGILYSNGTSDWVDGAMFCVDIVNGTTIWRSDFDDSFQWSSPAIYNGHIYIASNNYKLYCFNADSGEVVWDYQLSSPPSGIWPLPGPYSPAIADGKVYVLSMGRYSGKFYCFNASSGEVIWSFAKLGWLPESRDLAIADEKVFVSFGKYYRSNAVLYCFSDIDPNAPGAPSISGSSSGKTGETCEYTITTEDPNDDNVYFYINWGDGGVDEWIGPYASGESVTVNHTWSKKGKYEIRARAKDTDGLRGAIGSLKVSMLKNQQSTDNLLNNRLFFKFLEHHSRTFPILQQMLEIDEPVKNLV